MATGKIVEIVLTSGYGFINSDKGTRIFFHQRWLTGAAKFRELKEGDEVIFNLDKGPRGIRARDVNLLANVEPSQRMIYEAGDLAFENRQNSYKLARAQRPARPRNEGAMNGSTANAKETVSVGDSDPKLRWTKKILSIFKE